MGSGAKVLDLFQLVASAGPTNVAALGRTSGGVENARESGA